MISTYYIYQHRIYSDFISNNSLLLASSLFCSIMHCKIAFTFYKVSNHTHTFPVKFTAIINPSIALPGAHVVIKTPGTEPTIGNRVGK